MKIKTAELIGAALDWAVKAPLDFRVSRYVPIECRVWGQSLPRTNGCRIWMGKQNAFGYGMCRVSGREVRAHRALYFALNPDADPNLIVMHTCDNPACVNPAHLRLGTVRDNMLDMRAKGRFRGGAKPGNKNAVGNKGWMKGGAVAQRRLAASKLGDEVDVPEELV